MSTTDTPDTFATPDILNTPDTFATPNTLATSDKSYTPDTSDISDNTSSSKVSLFMKKYKYPIIIIIILISILIVVIIVLTFTVFIPLSKKNTSKNIRPLDDYWTTESKIETNMQDLKINQKTNNNSNESTNTIDNSVIVTMPNNALSDVEISTKQTNRNSGFKTQKFKQNIVQKISTDATSTFSSDYINKGPYLNFNNVYYGRLDKSCGKEIDLNKLITKPAPNEQRLHINNRILNDLIGNKCKEDQYLYLTGTAEGEQFI